MSCSLFLSYSGLAIRMVEPLYTAPSLFGVLPSLIFPQNLPSIVCSHILDPQPGETILDMCAAPGEPAGFTQGSQPLWKSWKTSKMSLHFSRQGDLSEFGTNTKNQGKLTEFNSDPEGKVFFRSDWSMCLLYHVSMVRPLIDWLW